MKKMFENKTRKIIAALAVGLLLSMVLSVGVVVADPLVLGTITGSYPDGTSAGALQGAQVSATCNGVKVGPTTSWGTGYYELNLSTTGCVVGDTVDVVATYSGHTGSASGAISGTGDPDGSILTVNVAVVCVDIPIPEFATIAIPAAGILGLLFFFNHRKHKKE